MASSKLMASPPSANSTNSDLLHQSSLNNADDILRNLYGKSMNHNGSSVVYKQVPNFGEMTLEDYLTKAGVVREEDIGVQLGQEIYEMNSMVNTGFEQQSDGSSLGLLKGKRKVVQETDDRVVQQRQKRMIKNRESAARSREKKQAYIMELETRVDHLQKENARLISEKKALDQQRLRQLNEDQTSIHEKPRIPQHLRRTRSMQW